MVAVALLLRLVVYSVEETKVAVKLTFGKPTGEVSEPGPHLKWPYPIQDVVSYDGRLRVLKGPFEQLTTSDQRPLLVSGFLLWRIASPQVFQKEVKDEAAAEIKLRGFLRTAIQNEVGQVAFGQLISTDLSQLQYDQVESRMLGRIREKLKANNIGVEVAMAGIRRLGLPKEATAAVFSRMREERRAAAAGIIADGRAKAGQIRAQAEGKKAELIAAAEAQAETILAEAESEVTRLYEDVREDPELYIYLQEVKALRKLLDQRTTLVFDPSQPPFNLLSRSLEQAQEGEGQ
jgi:membrane protease subunit HflC